MKALLRRIRQILRDRRTRRIFTRFVSTAAAIVVFVTTYALVLPAITMESQAACGIEAHQHNDDCFEEALVCGLEESSGHTHTDACYEITAVLVCGLEEHRHEKDCFDTEGNLICEITEHIHSKENGCYEEKTELICGLEESEGHQHDSSCYKKVLTCGKEIHSHSTACYKSDAADIAVTEHAAVASTESAGLAVTVADEDADEASNSSTDLVITDPEGISGTESTAGTDAATTESTAASAGYVPVLNEIYMPAVLNRKTGIYIVASEAALISATDDAEWRRIDDSTELGENDLLRVYLAYTLPAGSLNETNAAARYRLPANIRLTDEQINSINTTVNGIANQYVNLDTLEILDYESYQASLGIEAVEGTRMPDQDLNDYLTDLQKSGKDAVEYISATVKAENVYDETGKTYLGQDLIFTFTPYTVDKNRHEYDTDGQPTKAGEEVSGWIAFDLTTEQIVWDQDDAEENDAKTADIVFAEKDKDLGIHEISTELKLLNTAEDTSEEEKADEAVSTDDDSDGNGNADDSSTATTTNTTTAPHPDNLDEHENDQVDNTDNSAENATQAGTEESANVADDKNESKKENVSYPAVSFDDSVTVSAGSLSTDTKENSGNANRNNNKSTKITVHVEADKDTFPEGTTMLLSAVSDDQMTTVAEAVEGAVDDRKTMGFHAVDISFRDVNGNEIEPLKPIKVSMTSDAIQRAVEDESTAPVVVHVEDGDSHTSHTAETENSNPAPYESPEGSTAAEIADPAEKEKADAPTATVIEANTEGSDASHGSTDNTLTFEAASFSVYAIVYTVDFEYSVDDENVTKTLYFSLPGGESVQLSDLIEVLGIIGDTNFENVDAFLAEIKSVEFSDPALVKVTKNLIGDDWTLESLQPFTSEETLTITMEDGTQYTVKVTDAQYTNDLNSLLTDISVTVNGQELQDGQTVNSGDQFNLHLEITENDFFQLPDDTTEMVYRLPNGITLDSGTSYITINMGIDGKVYRNKLVYDPETNTLKLTWNTKDPNFSKLISNDNTKVVLDITGSFNEDATHVDFSGDLGVDVVPVEHHDADINKSGQLYLPGANGNPYNQPAIKYTVTVTSDGTTTVNVNDVVEGSAVTLDTTNWTAVSNKGTTITPVFTNKGFSLNNQTLQDGEVVTITYWGKVDTSGIQNLTDVSYSQTGNKVTLTGDNIPTKEKTHYEHEVGQNKMSKSAEHVGDVGADGKQTIDWKIVANSNPLESIGGSTITDRIAADSRQYMSYSGTGITVVAKRADGTVVSTNTYNWNSSNLSMTDTDSDKHWTFTVPDTNEALTYEITYTTEVDTTKYNNGNGGLFTVVNNTEGKPGTSSGSAAAGTPVTPEPQPVNYTKKAVDVSEDEIVWNISVNIDAANSGYYNPFNITEYIPNHAFGSIGYTDDLESITVEGLQGSEWYSLSYNYTKSNDDAWKRTGDNTKPTEVVLTFYRDGKQGDDVQNQNDQNSTSNPGINASTNRTLTIQVVTKNSAGWMELAARDGIAHQDYLTHTNRAKINDWSQVSATANPMAKVVYKMRNGKVEVQGSETAASYKAVETPGNSQGTITDNAQVQYPAYKFWVIVGGVTKDNLNENNQVVIEDEFDPLFRLMMDNEFGKGTRYGYGTSPTSFDAKTPDASSGESFVWTQSDGKATFVITNPKKNGDNYYPYYTVEYWLVPKSEEAYQQIKQLTLEEGGEKLFENKASSGDSETELDFKYNYNVIDKSSVAESSDTLTLLKYTIKINPDKLTLNNGETMTMTDTYSKNLSVDFGSITVTAVDKNGNDRSADVTWDYRGNVGTFTIPDETYVLLQYNARAVGDPGSVQTVSNTAYMEGYYDTETKDQIVDISGGGTSERVRIRLLKFAADHMEGGLDGAVFRLLDQDMNPVIDMNGNEVTYTTGTGYLSKYGVIHAADDKLDYEDKGTGDTASYDAGVYESDLNETGRARWQAGTIANPTSDSDKIVTYADLSPAGMARLGITLHGGFAEIFMNQNTQGAALKKERVYYLEEIKTPVGPDGQHYEKTNVKYSFLISDQSDYSAPSGVYVYHNNDVMTVRNWPTENATLQISKTFTGNVELTDAQKNKVTFTIKKKNSEGAFVDFPISVYNEETGQIEQKATFTYGDKKDADGTPLFVDGVLTIEDIEAGEYQVVESNIEVTDTTETIMYRTEYLVDGDKQIPTDSGVTVTITDEDIQNNASHDVAVTNSYFTNKYELQKYAADTAQAISGAKFKIVKIDPTTGTETVVKENLETDSDGKLDIRFTSNTWDSSFQFDTQALYYVVETAAPTGFVLPATPEKYYFYFSANPATEQPSDWTPGKKSTENPGGLPSGETAVDLAKSYGSAAVPNRRDTTKTYVNVNKKWVNSLGRDITSTMTDAEAVSVNLYRTTQKLAEGTVITNGDIENTNTASEIKTLTVKNGDTVVNTLYFLPGDKIQITAQGASGLSNANLSVNPYQAATTLVSSDTRKSWSFTVASSDVTATITGATGAIGVTTTNVTAANRVYVLSKTQAENITKDSSFSQTATLNASGNWTYTFSDLDVTDTATGLNYFYYVVEDDATTDTTYDVESKSVTVTNKAPEQLEVNKRWEDSDGNSINNEKTNGSITYELYQVENPLAVGPYTGNGEYSVSIAGLNSDGIWNHVKPNLTDNTTNIKAGSKIKLEIAANNASNQDLTGDVTITGATVLSDANVPVPIDMGGWTAYYHKRTIEISDVTGNIQISGTITTNTELDLVVTVLEEPTEADTEWEALVKNKLGEIVVTHDNATLTKATAFENSNFRVTPGAKAWSSLVYNLPSSGTKNGKTVNYSYYVVEKEVSGFNTTYQLDGTSVEYANSEPGGTIVIVNKELEKPKGSVTVTKNFSGITENELPTDFKITASWTEGGTSKTAELTSSGLQPENVTLTGSWPNYTWTITELSRDTVVTFTETGYDVAGYNVTVTGSSAAEDKTSATATAGETPGAASFTNTYEKKVTNFEFTKEWHDSSDNVVTTWETGKKIKVEVYKYLTPDKTKNGVIGTYEITKTADGFTITKNPDAAPTLVNVENTFTFQMTNLDGYGKVGEESGDLEYFAREEKVDGYKDPAYANLGIDGGTYMSGGTEALNHGKIINRPEEAYELPSTGGPGTRIFTILGSILVMFAGVMLWRRRRYI